MARMPLLRRASKHHGIVKQRMARRDSRNIISNIAPLVTEKRRGENSISSISMAWRNNATRSGSVSGVANTLRAWHALISV